MIIVFVCFCLYYSHILGKLNKDIDDFGSTSLIRKIQLHNIAGTDPCRLSFKG